MLIVLTFMFITNIKRKLYKLQQILKRLLQ